MITIRKRELKTSHMQKTMGKAGFAKKQRQIANAFPVLCVLPVYSLTSKYPYYMRDFRPYATAKQKQLYCNLRPKNPAHLSAEGKACSIQSSQNDFCCMCMALLWRTCETIVCIWAAARSCYCRNMLPDALEHVCAAFMPQGACFRAQAGNSEYPPVLPRTKGLKHLARCPLKAGHFAF